MPASEPQRSSYDLHLHTYWSYDATANPESHFRCARELGVKCITITDHHVLDGLEEVLEIAEGYPEVTTIPSAELTVTTSIGAVDLVCFGFPREIPESMKPVLSAYHEWQRATGTAISKGLVALGHGFSDEDRLELLKSYRPAKAIRVQGSTHVKGEVIRRYCVEQGFIDNIDQHSELMKRAGRKVKFPPYPHASDVVPAVKEVGAHIAIAHPFGYFKECDLERMDALRKECSLDGIECAHPSVPAEYTGRYREYCEKHGLFSTGGSDCHSDEGLADVMAAHGGPNEWLDEFLDRVASR
jgi:predicted metal-dependent phosphoesterase TrpH